MFHPNFQTPRSGLKKKDAQPSFLTNFEVFGNRMKHSFECSIQLLKPLTILGEIQRKVSTNFVIIKITFSNLLHGSDFLSYLFMNC